MSVVEKWVKKDLVTGVFTHECGNKSLGTRKLETGQGNFGIDPSGHKHIKTKRGH